MNDTLIDRVMMDCPMCDEEHLVEKWVRTSKVTIKGESVEYLETYYKCTEDDESFVFIPAKLMNENLLVARDAYRSAHGLLTSQEIVQLRKRYGLTQKEFALLLGWGEITVTRYETKQIQDETHDNLMKVARDNALEARNLLVRNRASFESARYEEILEVINNEVERTSVVYFAKQKIKARHIAYQGNKEATGGARLDIDKVRNMMLFFASKCQNLYKVKLMKLLWFADALFCQRYNTSMSGLVYQHMPMGALPIVHNDLMELVPVETIVDDYSQLESYRVLPCPDFSEDVFSTDERDVLYAVMRKFKSYTGKEIANYMHEEAAYTQTKNREIIPFSLAKKVRPF